MARGVGFEPTSTGFGIQCLILLDQPPIKYKKII